MTIDICIPAYNEEEIIEESVREVRAAFSSRPDLAVNVIVADNNSSDATAARAAASGASVLSVPLQGKGAAVRAAAAASGADLFGFIDADLSASPEEFLRLVEVLEGGNTDIAIGSRLHKDAQVERSYLRTLSSKAFNTFRRIVLGLAVEDTQCGLKLMRPHVRDLFVRGFETGWFFDIEILAQAHHAGHRISEVPIAWKEERFQGRASKLRILRDGFQGGLAILRIRRRLGAS